MTLSRAGSRSQSEPATESLAEALTALCAEVGIPFEEMLHTVEGALAVAYARAFSPAGEITVKLDTKTGGLEVRSRIVRSDGSEMIEMLPSEDFKRLAAQTAKHAVLRHIHDLERDKVLRDVAEHRGELATGIVDRFEAGTVYVDLGRAEGVMPPEEQIPGELLHPGRPVLVVILGAPRARSSIACSKRRCRKSRPALCRCGRSRESRDCGPRSQCRRPSRASIPSARVWVRRESVTAPSSASLRASTSTSFRGRMIP